MTIIFIELFVSSLKLTPFMCKFQLIEGFLMNGFSIGCVV